MKITKRQLRRLIREACGDAPVEEVSVDLPPVEPAVATELVVESETPEHDMLVEMEIATRSLEQVVESVQNAAHLCHNCGVGVVEQAPIVEALATQAEALQEMLEAQVAVIQENTEVGGVSDTPVLDVVADLVQ